MGSGFIPSGTVLPPSVSTPDLLAVNAENHTDQTTGTYATLLKDIKPVVAKRQSEYTEASEYVQHLGTVAREVDQDIKDAQSACAKVRVDSIHERVAMGPACEAQQLGIRLQGFDAKVAFLRDCRDMLAYVQLPSAQRARLESFLALRQAEEARAGIEYALKKSELLDKLILSGVYIDNGPRVGLYSEELERLQAAREQAARAVDQAKLELREEITRQQAAQQARSVNGTITKAELAFHLVTSQQQ